MCPPTPISGRWARVTMTAAFHRFQLRYRRSMISSPGKYGSSWTPIVLTYGVVIDVGIATLRSLARFSRFKRTYRARGPPRSSISPSRESTHSPVSAGSISGTWLNRPLINGRDSSCVATCNLTSSPEHCGAVCPIARLVRSMVFARLHVPFAKYSSSPDVLPFSVQGGRESHPVDRRLDVTFVTSTESRGSRPVFHRATPGPGRVRTSWVRAWEGGRGARRRPKVRLLGVSSWIPGATWRGVGYVCDH